MVVRDMVVRGMVVWVTVVRGMVVRVAMVDMLTMSPNEHYFDWIIPKLMFPFKIKCISERKARQF